MGEFKIFEDRTPKRILVGIVGGFTPMINAGDCPPVGFSGFCCGNGGAGAVIERAGGISYRRNERIETYMLFRDGIF